jgi:biopolymer transport protein ExbB
MTIDRIIHIASASGGILYIMSIVLLVALTVIVERSWYLKRVIREGSAISHAISSLHHLDKESIEELSLRAERFPHGALLSVPLRYPEVHDPNRLSELLDESILWQAPRIDRSLWMLDTIVTLAPLLGLLGTIIGMFNAFQVLGAASSAPTQITGGVAEALVATASGLFIAIIGLVFFNGLSNHVRLIIHQLETIKVMLVNRLAAPRKPLGVKRNEGAALSAVARDVEAA